MRLPDYLLGGPSPEWVQMSSETWVLGFVGDSSFEEQIHQVSYVQRIYKLDTKVGQQSRLIVEFQFPQGFDVEEWFSHLAEEYVGNISSWKTTPVVYTAVRVE